MSHLLRVAAAALLAWCLMPGIADAYRYAPGYPRWQAQKMPIKFYVTYSGNDNWGGRSKEEVKELINEAFKIWTNASCHNVVFQFAGFTATDQAGTQDGKNVITWVGGLPGVS